MKYFYILCASLFLTVIFAFSCGCVELPGEELLHADTGPAAADTSPTPTPTQAYLTPSTPRPTPSTGDLARPTSRNPPEMTPPAVNYTEIYNETLAFRYNTTAFEYELKYPPMIIQFVVTPTYETRTKYATSQFGTKEWESSTVTFIPPSSWMKVSVYHTATGITVAQEGFNGEYSTDLNNEIQIRTAGTYTIEFTGNQVTAAVSISVAKV